MVLWPPHERVNSLEKFLIWEDWEQEEKTTTQDEMAGRACWLDGHRVSELRSW